MKKYQDKSIDDIKVDDTIPKQDKDRMIKLLELGIKYAEIKTRSWQDNFDILERCISSNPEVKKYFEENGVVPDKTVFEDVTIGFWLRDQKQNLMKKYQGMSIEEIEADENIPDRDKEKMKKLLGLGVGYPNQSIEWEEGYRLVSEYLNESEDGREFFEKHKNIKKNTVYRGVNLSSWLRRQRDNLMRNYQDMTIEEIEADESIPLEDKEKMLKLLHMGVGYPTDRRDWEENLEIVTEYINSDEELKKELSERGRLSRSAVFRGLAIDHWIDTQRSRIMKNYQGMSVEQIEADEAIPADDKKKMKALLQLGIGYPNAYDWDDYYNLLVEYINSNDTRKKEFEEKKGVVSELEYKDVNLGIWLHTQKGRLMKKYQGMSIESVEKDETIPAEEKDRLLKLLKLGVGYPVQKLDWQDNFVLLEEFINESEERRQEFERKGVIHTDTEYKGARIGRWLNTQKQTLMKKYQDRKVEDIEADDSIPQEEKERLLRLLKLGVKYSKQRENLKEKIAAAQEAEEALSLAQRLELQYKREVEKKQGNKYKKPEVTQGG